MIRLKKGYEQHRYSGLDPTSHSVISVLLSELSENQLAAFRLVDPTGIGRLIEGEAKTNPVFNPDAENLSSDAEKENEPKPNSKGRK